MAEKINLEVPAELAALSTVRIVLSGLGAHLDLSLEELEDVSLATDELLRAALAAERLERFTVELLLKGGQLRITVGEFASPRLRSSLQQKQVDEPCLGLCRLLSSTVDEVEIIPTDHGYCVALAKWRRERVV